MDRTLFGLMAFLVMASCSSSNNAPESSDQAAVVRQYAVLLDANYKDVTLRVAALKVAVDALVAAPSGNPQNLRAVRVP